MKIRTWREPASRATKMAEAGRGPRLAGWAKRAGKPRGWRAVAIDPVTRKARLGSCVVQADGTVVLRLPLRLASPNETLHAHFRVRTEIKKAWRAQLEAAVATATGRLSVADAEPLVRALGLEPCAGRRRVEVTRLVPSVRNLIKDDDNLVYAQKPLLDQIRRAGFLRDDARAWTELAPPVQAVSEDGLDWTVVVITPLDPTPEQLLG